MGLVPVKTPVIVKWMFSNYIWDIPTADKIIYLTFDDGPTLKITNWTLDVLKAYNAKATFFCIGDNVNNHPEIFKTILSEGHAIGNHTQNHVKGWKTKTKDYLKNTAKAQDIIDSHIEAFKIQNPEITNPETLVCNLFRPPYGQITPKQGKKLIAQGFNIIMWDVISFDWEHDISRETCLKNVISKTTKGSIIVFHDSVKASKNMEYALPKVLEYFTKKGYIFKAITT